MTSRSIHVLMRLSQMSGDELRTRVSQAANKRLDALAYRLGHDFTKTHFQNSEARPKFFFGSDELADRIALLEKFLPTETARIREEADAICQHRFNLLGYTNLEYGKQIDWHLDAVHGKRAPLKPWFKINFLDFNQVGDHKIIWELNRHQHLVTLAKAWALTREPLYAEEIADQWYSWQRENPYPIGINWGSALEVAFRSLSWLWVANLLDESAPLPSTFRLDLNRALVVNGRYLEKYLSTYFSPNTHLLGEAVALFFIGTLCPQIPRAKHWANRGWNIILQAAQRQVRVDGVYFEQALHYHVYALDFFLHARILAARNDMPVPAEFDAILEKMLEVVEVLSQAGPPEGFGDDDGGRVFNPRRNRTEHMIDPLAMGAGVFGRETIRAAAQLTEEAVWLLGERAAQSLEAHPKREIRSRAFREGGLYVMAGATPCPYQIVVDAGPQGVGHCGHGHADALSVRVAVDGRRVLVDPGTCSYIDDTNDRDVFRGTAAHNTLRIDEQNQAVSAGPFAWTGVTNTQVERWVIGDSFDLLIANHDGYQSLPDPVLHRRFVFRGPDSISLIRDVCEGHGRHSVESFWHFGEDFRIDHEPGRFICLPAEGDKSKIGLALLIATNGDWKAEPGSGFVSPAYGMKNPAPMARLSASTELPVEYALLMLPHRIGQELGDFRQITEAHGSNVRVYQYQSADALHRFFFSEVGGKWMADEWTSDAAFLYCVSSPRRPNAAKADQLRRVIMVAGSFATRSDTNIVSHPQAVERWEWSLSDSKLGNPNPALEFAGR